MSQAEKICNIINKLFEYGEIKAEVKKENEQEIIYINSFINYWDTEMTIAKLDGTSLLFLGCDDEISYSINFRDFFMDGFPDKYEHITEEVEEALFDNPDYILELSEDNPILIDYCKCLLEFIYFVYIENIGYLATTAFEIREYIKTITKRANIKRTNTFEKDILKMINSDIFYFE